MLRLPHSDYFRDRHSEEELCQDFPADKIFIRGLHAMQAHFDNNGVYVEIPVVRVMNTAHYIAAYMFATTCSGDQLEYEVLAYDSFGCDKKLVPLTMIVLAAMLQRTEGFRAKQCRNLILDNRDPDFEEGVTLYDRFLRSAEEHFAEEDFLIDTHTLVQRNQQLEYENRQLITENKKLKIKYQNMEEKYQQINIGTLNQIGTQNQYNITYMTPASEEPKWSTTQQAPVSNIPQELLFKYIHPSVTDEVERVKIHHEIANLVRALPLSEICRYLRQMYKDKKVYLNVKTDAMFEELHRMGMPDESNPGFSQKNFQNYFNIND